jgi:steroid delta-isomerase-like uncharacterized protein
MIEPYEYPQRAAAAFNARDFDTLASLWAPAFAYHGPGDESDGRGAALAREHALVAAFPDAVVALDEFVASTDRLVAEGTMRGTHSGPLRVGDLDLPPTGRAIVMRFAALFELGDGVVQCERVYYDRVDLLQQLGVGAGGAR